MTRYFLLHLFPSFGPAVVICTSMLSAVRIFPFSFSHQARPENMRVLICPPSNGVGALELGGSFFTPLALMHWGAAPESTRTGNRYPRICQRIRERPLGWFSLCWLCRLPSGVLLMAQLLTSSRNFRLCPELAFASLRFLREELATSKTLTSSHMEGGQTLFFLLLPLRKARICFRDPKPEPPKSLEQKTTTLPPGPDPQILKNTQKYKECPTNTSLRVFLEVFLRSSGLGPGW